MHILSIINGINRGGTAFPIPSLVEIMEQSEY